MRDKPKYIKDIVKEKWYAKLSEDGLSYGEEHLVYCSEGIKIRHGCFINCEYILNENNEIASNDYIEITKEEYNEGTLKIIIGDLVKQKENFKKRIRGINKLIDMVKERFDK